MINSVLLTLAIVCGVVSWIYSGVSLALIFENHRFWRVRQKSTPPAAHSFARVAIIISCQRLEHGMRGNLSRFLQQDHPNYEVIFVMDRSTDRTSQLICNLINENRCVNARLVDAGCSENGGQENPSLRAALNLVSNDVEILAFADSGIKPDTTWLRCLVNRLGRETVGARMGGRWMLPLNNSLPSLLACSINNAQVAMMGRGKRHLVWSGTWAINRKLFERLGIRDAWTGTQFGDLAASRAIREFGLDIEFEPRCVSASSVEFSLLELVGFLRQQSWVASISQLGFWVGLIGGIWAISVDNWLGYLAVGSSILLNATEIANGVVRNNMARRSVPQWRLNRKARKFDLFGAPLTGMVAICSLVVSCFLPERRAPVTDRNLLHERHSIDGEGSPQPIVDSEPAMVAAADQELQILPFVFLANDKQTVGAIGDNLNRRNAA